jgi:hypothetical protein
VEAQVDLKLLDPLLLLVVISSNKLLVILEAAVELGRQDFQAAVAAVAVAAATFKKLSLLLP